MRNKDFNFFLRNEEQGCLLGFLKLNLGSCKFEYTFKLNLHDLFKLSLHNLLKMNLCMYT